MSLIEAFPEDIKATLVALPYRVGLYVSFSDMSGGADADEREYLTLANVVTYYSEDTIKSEFAQSVMEQTVKSRANWGGWKADLNQVPDECKRITEFLVGHIEAKDLVAFKNNLLEIGITVAMAYREFSGQEPIFEKLATYLEIFIARLKATLTGKAVKSFDELLNISKQEKAAINKLAAAMNIEYTVG